LAEVSVRPAGIDDAEFVWQCRNDSTARAASRSVDPIPLDEHLEWFRRRLVTAETTFLNVMVDSERAGYVRLHRGGQETEISIALAPTARRKGVGTAAIRAAAEAEAAERATPIAAYVKDDNPASLAAFRRAGFSGDTVSEDLRRLVFVPSA
jgi:UDP-2,4-diacetamido-2,4,6-trideoxy-beta-L-altropyranose hydrolase